MYRLVLMLLLSLPLSAASQEFPTFSNGQVADADEINASLRFLLDKIEALEARVSVLEAVGYSLDLDGDGVPNNCDYPMAYLLKVMEAGDRTVSLENNYLVTSPGSVNDIRMWEFPLPENLTISSSDQLDFYLDIREVRPNENSDSVFGVTDGTMMLKYRNNGLGNGSTSPIYALPYKQTNSGWVFDFPNGTYDGDALVNFSGLSNYRLSFSLTRAVSRVTVTNWEDNTSETVELQQTLDVNGALLIVIHGQEANESYKFSRFKIGFADADVPSCQ